jgi:imidazolonepropionase
MAKAGSVGVLLPGLCDGHTHPVWAGDRVNEFKMKLAGASYMDVHKQGGGIQFSVRKTREASHDELATLFAQRLDRMLRHGTTLIEAKSGYGLRWPTELKMLRVLHEVNRVHPIDVVSNFCGAHSVPKGSTAAQAAADVIDVQLPALKLATQRGVISPEFIDVFCEKGVFDTPTSQRILKAGQAAGLRVNFHGDELNPTASAELAGALDATACSHLEHISDAGIAAMAKAGSVGVLLPTTAYVLRIEPPPARKMITGGMCVALGSDFNPNAHSLSMPFVMNLACVTMRMTCNEALVAATINAAASVNRSATHGSLELGKYGDVVVLDAPQWEHIVYQLVDPPISAVFKEGRLVWQHNNKAA